MSPRTDQQFELIRLESKRRIMEAALELFANNGYHNTSISKISTRASVSKGLMYNYFKNKQELLRELVQEGLGEAFMHMPKRAEGTASKEFLRQQIDWYFDLIQHNKNRWKLYFSITMQVNDIPEIHKLFADQMENHIQAISKLFKELKIKDHEFEARNFLAHLDGIFFHALMFEELFPIEKTKEELIKKYC